MRRLVLSKPMRCAITPFVAIASGSIMLSIAAWAHDWTGIAIIGAVQMIFAVLAGADAFLLSESIAQNWEMLDFVRAEQSEGSA